MQVQSPKFKPESHQKKKLQELRDNPQNGSKSLPAFQWLKD
jgi:hypothetical protein